MDESEDKKTDALASTKTKKPYVRPALVRLGSLSDMTQSRGNQGRPDGGFSPKANRTGRGGRWVVDDA